MRPALDCCDVPRVVVDELVEDRLHRETRLLRCACGQHWLHESVEIVDWDDGADTWHERVSRLSEAAFRDRLLAREVGRPSAEA